MEDFISELKELLSTHFHDSEIELDALGAGRVGGLIAWNGFSGIEQIERQRQLWKFLREKLNREQQLKLSAILTLTPDEMAAARAG